MVAVLGDGMCGGLGAGRAGEFDGVGGLGRTLWGGDAGEAEGTLGAGYCEVFVWGRAWCLWSGRRYRAVGVVSSNALREE